MSKVPEDTFIDEEIDRQERCRMLWVNHYRGWVIFFTLIIFLPLLFVQPEKECRCLYMISVMIVFWVTEVLPLGITALIPIVGLPMFGIMDSKDTCLAYFQDAVFLFIGSLFISMAIEFSKLHTRIGLCLINRIGTNQRLLMLFFMLFTCIMSMLVPNLTITAIMCPILKSVLEELASEGLLELERPDIVGPEEEPRPSKMVTVFYLSVAYSATFGGMAFLESTGTHPVFKKLFEKEYPDDHSFDSKRWLGMALPVALLSVLVLYIWIQFFYFGFGRPNSKRAQAYKQNPEEMKRAAGSVKERRQALGKMSAHECQVVFVLVVMFLLLITLKPYYWSGYAEWLKAKEIKASFPVMLCTCILFLLPVNYAFLRYCICRAPNPVGERQALMTWRFVHKNMLWNMLLLFAGSLALARGVEESGLAKGMAKSLNIAKDWQAPLLQVGCIILAIVMTAFVANLAMAAVLTPIIIEFAKTTDWHVGYLLVPTILAVSVAFFLPVSTPANAIVAGKGNLRTRDMIVGGIGPTIIGILMICFCCNTWMFLMWSYFKGKTPKD